MRVLGFCGDGFCFRHVVCASEMDLLGKSHWGLKTSWLSPKYTDILGEFRQYLISVGKTSDLLQQVVDTLVMIE